MSRESDLISPQLSFDLETFEELQQSPEKKTAPTRLKNHLCEAHLLGTS